MKVFGTKQAQPTDADRIAAERLRTVAARYRAEPDFDLTEASPDPLGEPHECEEPKASDDEQEPREEE